MKSAKYHSAGMSPAVGEHVLEHVQDDEGIRCLESLVEYLSKLYLDPSRGDSDIISQVHIRSDGVLNGFIGSIPLRMSLDGSLVRAAICGPLMVGDHTDDPLAGARLLRAFLAGPQDSLAKWDRPMRLRTIMWSRTARHSAAGLQPGMGQSVPANCLCYRTCRWQVSGDAPSGAVGKAAGCSLVSEPANGSHPESAPVPELNGFVDSDIDFYDSLVGIIPSLLERFGLRPVLGCIRP